MWSQLIRRSWEENRLFSVLLELTYRCNWDCAFCYNDLGLRGTPLSLGQYFDLLDELRELAVLNLVLTGCEPLAHPEFLEIGERAREGGFVIRLKSNAHALRGRLAREVKERVDPFVVEVSLHGATAEVHDRQTRVPGSFERLLANLAELRSLGFRLKMTSVLTIWNQHQIADMFALADRLGVPLQIEPEVSPRDDGDRSPLDLSPTQEGIRELFSIVAERTRAAAPSPAGRAGEAAAGGAEPIAEQASTDRTEVDAVPRKHCGAGSSAVAIDPFGNVYPCVQWRRAAGNLHHRPLAEIWRRSPVLEEVRELTVEVTRRLDGLGADVARRMAFCPGAAEQAGGDPLAVYPAARQRVAAHRAVERPAVRSLPIVGVGSAGQPSVAKAPGA